MLQRKSVNSKIKPTDSKSQGNGRGRPTTSILKLAYLSVTTCTSNIKTENKIDKLKAAFHPCVNVYIWKPINRPEWRVLSLRLLNLKQNLSTIRKK